MGIIGTIKREARSRVTAGADLAKPPSWLTRLLGGGEGTLAGVDVNEYTAMNLSSFWCAVRNISEDVAKIPVGVYVRKDNSREELPDDPVSFLFNHAANPETTPLAFRQTMTQWALTHGNGFAEIESLNNGSPIALWQQQPQTVYVTRDRSDRIVYEVNSVRNGGRTVTLYADKMFHLHGMGFDGLTGYSVVHKARESIGAAIATDRYAGAFFGNGAVPAGILSHPGKLADGGKRLKESWNEQHKGPGKSRGVAVLEAELKYQAIGIPPEDGQFLETRVFQVQEIARWFRMPPHKLMELSRGTFSNIEHQSIEYVRDCLEPWFIRWEQECWRKFFGRTNPRYARHNMNALLRSDSESRARVYAIKKQWGLNNTNELRALEDENPIGDQGDVYLAPANMVPADKLEDLADATIKGKGDPNPQGDPPASNPENGNQNRAAELARGFRSQVLEATQRMARAATDKVSRAKKKGEFSTWYRSFIEEHRDHVKGVYFPIAEAITTIRAAFGPVDAMAFNASDIAGNLAARYIATIAHEFPDDFETKAPDTLADQAVRAIEAIIAGGTP